MLFRALPVYNPKEISKVEFLYNGITHYGFILPIVFSGKLEEVVGLGFSLSGVRPFEALGVSEEEVAEDVLVEAADEEELAAPESLLLFGKGAPPSIFI